MNDCPTELDELAQFLADRAPEPRRRQFKPLHNEILNIRLATLACAGALLLLPNGYDRINAAGLIGIVLAHR